MQELLTYIEKCKLKAQGTKSPREDLLYREVQELFYLLFKHIPNLYEFRLECNEFHHFVLLYNVNNLEVRWATIKLHQFASFSTGSKDEFKMWLVSQDLKESEMNAFFEALSFLKPQHLSKRYYFRERFISEYFSELSASPY